MFDLTNKQKTNFGLAVTFAVLLGACTSKAIKMESSEMALDVPYQEQVVVGEATQDSFQASDDTYTETPAYDASAATTASTGKSFHKKERKSLKSKQIAKRHKKSNKSFVAKADKNKKLDLNKQEVSAAAAVAQEIEVPQTFDQETSKYPSNDTLNNIVVPAPMQEAAMMDEGVSQQSSKAFWMYVLAGFLIVLGAGGYVYKTRFSKNGKRRKLVYNG